MGVFLEGVVEATTNGDSLVELRVSADGWPWRGREGPSLAILFTLRSTLPCLWHLARFLGLLACLGAS